MQKFTLVFLAVAFLGFLAPVESQALENRETNADRFARGMPPLPPSKRSVTESTSKLFPLFLKANLAADGGAFTNSGEAQGAFQEARET